MKLPENKTVVTLIDETVEQEHLADTQRPYMGISFIGHKCDRYLWLSYRWAAVDKFSGRMYRLFRRGDVEEILMTSYLRDAGMTPYFTSNPECPDCGQITLSYGICKGHADGVIPRGIPEAPEKLHILEMKTHNENSFKELVKLQVQAAKIMHYTQMQCYMYLAGQLDQFKGVERALYLSVNKNTDDLYFERVRLNKAEAKQSLDRACAIGVRDYMPHGISNDPTWYECKYCKFYDICHVSRLTKAINCRTCAHSTPKSDGTWTCELFHEDIPVDWQTQGCKCHVLHPDLTPWELETDLGVGTSAAYRMEDGQLIINGNDGYSSQSIVDGSWQPILEVQKTFNGKVVQSC